MKDTRRPAAQFFGAILLLSLGLISCTTTENRQPSNRILTTTPTPKDSPTVFDVQRGCQKVGRKIPARGDGINDDTSVIQDCLYAAGEEFAARCPARAWNPDPKLGYPDCPPAEVYLPAGKYFVQGTWQTLYPGHSANKNSAYAPHWVVFTLPRGVAVRGDGMDSTTITLNSSADCVLNKDNQGNPVSPNTCVEPRLSKRTGTYLFMGGFEKMPGYCDNQPRAKRNDRLCQSTPDEIAAGGAQNSFTDISLEGDRDALVNHWVGNMMKSQSTAIHMNMGRDLALTRVKTNYWYRALNSREGNGVRVLNSKFYNSMKASLYFIQPRTLPAVNHNIGDNPSSRHLIHVATNSIQNSPAFFEVIRNKNLKPWSALAGIYLTGNTHSASCSDVSLVNNTLKYSRIYYEQPCGSVLMERNRIVRTATAIQIGSYENNVGLNIAKDINVIGNEITESLGGILIRGCDFNDQEPRCQAPSARVIVRANQLSAFLPLEKTGSDPWVNLMSRRGRSPVAIATSDASYVKIESNQIWGLRSGSQLYGIGVQSSRWNTWYPDSTKAWLVEGDCYTPIQASRELTISKNTISFSDLPNENDLLGLRDKQNVGVYVENATNVDYTAGETKRVESNRLIRATLASPSNDFCSLSGIGFAPCARRIDTGRLLMSDTCLNKLDGCQFRIPGMPAKENLDEFYIRYKSRCTSGDKDSSDEEFRLPNQ